MTGANATLNVTPWDTPVTEVGAGRTLRDGVLVGSDTRTYKPLSEEAKQRTDSGCSASGCD
jgi:hypothetical protein